MKYTNDHILEFLEEWAPQSTKLEYDNVGLLIGEESQKISKVIVCLDVTPEVIEEAISEQAELILAHHPLIFRKLSRITGSDPAGSMIFRLIRNNISVIAAHTNLDAAPGGVSFVLAERLGLQNVRFLKVSPATDAQQDTRDVNRNRYSSEIEQYDNVSAVASGFGTLGELSESMTTEAFLEHVQSRLKSGVLRYSGHNDEIRSVAVCGGSGSFLAEEAVKQHADAFVTADLKYHDFFSEYPSLLLVDAGHYESEIPITEHMCSRLNDRFPELEIQITRINTNPVQYFSIETPTVKKSKPVKDTLC